MRHLKKRATFGLGILGLAAAATAAAVLAFASGGNAASSNTCTQVVPVGAQQPPNANCLFVAVVPSVLSANRTGLLIVRFKNIFANATATHTVLKAILPSGASIVANPPGVTASTNNATCSQQTVSCSFGSVPGGSIVSMYVQFTIVPQDNPPAQLDPVKGFVSFDESNGNTGTTTNDSFETDSGSTQIVASISGTTGGDQGGLCSNDLTQTGFTTTNNGQQAKIANLPAGAPGLPCTPVSAGVRIPTADELAACGSACPANTAFVFFPVLAGNAAAVLTLNYPTIPSFVKSWKQTPLFEFLPDKNGVLTLVQLVTCGVKPNPSPDSCLLGDPQKFGASGVSFTVSVSGSDLDGRFSP
jgi:hypothetical protein